MSDHSLIIKLGLDTADSKKRVSEINKELKSLDKQIKSLDTSTDDFETNMNNMAKKMDLAKTSVVGLSEKLEEQNKQLEKAEKHLNSAKEELDNFKNSGEQNAKKLKELETRVNSAQSSYNKLQREVTDTTMQLEKATKSLNDMESQFKKMSFEQLTKDFKTVSKNVDEARNSLESLESTLSIQNQSLKNYESYLKGLVNQLEKYKKSNDSTSEGIKEFENEIDKTRVTISQLEQEISQTEQALSSANQEFKELESVFNKISFDNTFKELKNEIKEIDTETDDFSRNIQNMATKIDLSKQSVGVLTDYLQKQNQELNESKTNLQKVQQEFDEYRNSADRTADGVNDLKQKLSIAENAFNTLEQEVNQTEQALEQARQEVSQLEKEFSQMKIDKLTNDLKNVSDAFGKVAEATQPLSVALAGLGTLGVKGFIEMEGSLVKVKNMLGLTDVQANILYDTAQNLASKGFAEFDEVLDVLANVKLMLGDVLNDSQLEGFTKGILAITQTFDADLNDVLKTTQMLMTNFGISGEKSLDIIAYGFQNGLNYSEDFLDTLWEYSVQFADMGYSAEEFAFILEEGFKNGIFNTDKLADGIKEANIRLKEMPEATGEAVKTLGLDMNKIQSDIAKGGDIAKKAMDNVCEAIMSIEDPVKRNQVGVEIFGTMWEDCGVAIAQSITSINDNASTLEGTTNKMSGSIENMNKEIENMNDGGLAELKIKMQEAFEIIGEKLYPMFEKLIDGVIGGVDKFNNLDSSLQSVITGFGLFATVLSPSLLVLSKLGSGFGTLITTINKFRVTLGAFDLITTNMITLEKAMECIPGFSEKIFHLMESFNGLKATLGGLATSFAPYLVGGAIIAGVVAGAIILKNHFDEVKEKALLLAEGYEGDTARMTQANKLLMDDFNEKFSNAKADIETFSEEASSLLAKAFADAQEPTSLNLDDYNTLVFNKLQETLGIIEEHETQMLSDLSLLNSNYANQTVIGWDAMNTITENKGKEMNKKVQTAYDNLINTQKMSSYVGQEITDEYGNKMVYTWEMYYNDLEKAQADFETESLKAQVGFYGDELFNTQTFVNDIGATNRVAYSEQINDAKKQRDEMIKISEEERDKKLKVIQQLTDEELEILDMSREDLVEIAVLQHEQIAQEAEGLYQDAVAEYTSMAGDIKGLSKETKELTIENAQEMKQGTVDEIAELQGRIDKILEKSGGDFKDYSNSASKSTEGMKSRVVSALGDTEANFQTTGGVVSRESSKMKNAIDSIKSKEITITAKFQSINFQTVKNQVESMGSHVYSAGISSYKDYLDGLPSNFGTDYAQDLYGLKDAGVRTISLANLGMDTISAIAGKDGGSIVNNAVATYNYNNNQTMQEMKIKPIEIPQPQATDRSIEVNINIDQMGMGTTKEEVRKLVKMIEQEIRIHGKKW